MTHLIALALLTLFTAFKVKTGLVQLRPFDALVAVMLALTLVKGSSGARSRMPAGFLILLPFFFWHVFSALTFGLENGIREALQIAIVTAFAFVVVAHVDDIDYGKLARLMLVGLVLITAYNIYWHVSHGFWTGWKRLVDPKRAFNFLPLVLSCLIIFGGRARLRYWILWAILSGVIAMSGERKALLIYLILSAVLLARRRIWAAIPAMGAGVLALILLSLAVQDPYLERQFRSVLNPFGESTTSLSAIASGAYPESISDAQRGFALRLSMELFAQRPFVGVGTNAYSAVVERRYAYLPDFMRTSAHGEFQRVLVENGAIGFLLYLSIWGAALARLRPVLRQAARSHLVSRSVAMSLSIVLVVPPLVYVAFEAAGTHAFVVLTFISLLPETCRAAFEARAQTIRMRIKRRPLCLRAIDCPTTIESSHGP